MRQPRIRMKSWATHPAITGAAAAAEPARPAGPRRATEHKVEGNGHFFWVADPDGRVVSKAYRTFREAADRAEKLTGEARLAERFGRARRRPCLCCGREFSSEGIHNRLCGYCTKVDHAPANW
ncbi:hypothetical protein [Albidovulum sp.]|uniref:hypothetical protein n=1 Tax=Albidovulum sp. TaxID=1872424 RepID=UPI0039B8441C